MLANIVVDVRPAPDPPQLEGGVTFEVAEDIGGETPLLVFDPDDPEGASLAYSFAVATPPANGAVSFIENPGAAWSLQYAPDVDFVGIDRFTVVASDSAQLASVPASFTVVVLSAADAPVARDQAIDVDEDSISVLQLDASSPDDDAFEFVLDVLPMHGTFTADVDFAENGRGIYEPDENYVGVDVIRWHAEANGGVLQSAPAQMTLTMRPVDDAPIVTTRTLTWRSLGNGAADDVAAISVFDPDVGDVQTLTISAPPTFGDVELLGSSVDPLTSVTRYDVRYTPDNLTSPRPMPYAGPDAFTVSVDDGVGPAVSATVSVQVVSTASCAAALLTGATASGVYVMQGASGPEVATWCELDEAQDGGGWALAGRIAPFDFGWSDFGQHWGNGVASTDPAPTGPSGHTESFEATPFTDVRMSFLADVGGTVAGPSIILDIDDTDPDTPRPSLLSLFAPPVTLVTRNGMLDWYAMFEPNATVTGDCVSEGVNAQGSVVGDNCRICAIQKFSAPCAGRPVDFYGVGLPSTAAGRVTVLAGGGFSSQFAGDTVLLWTRDRHFEDDLPPIASCSDPIVTLAGVYGRVPSGVLSCAP